MTDQYSEDMRVVADAGNRDAAASRELYHGLLEQMEEVRQKIRASSDGSPQVELASVFTDTMINVIKVIAGLLDEAGSLRIVNIDQVAIKVFDALSAGLSPTQAERDAEAAEVAAAADQARRGT